MLATLILLAILTIGAISAADDADALAANDDDAAIESPINESDTIALDDENEVVGDDGKYNATMDISKEEGEVYLNDEITIGVTLYYDGAEQKFPEGDIILYLNNSEIDRKNGNCIYFAPFTFNDYGVYNFKVEYSGNDEFNGQTKEFSYNVTSARKYIFVQDEVLYGSDTFMVYTPVLNPNDIVITINGTKFNVYDQDDSHQCNASALSFGVNTVHVYYPGDETYGEYSGDANVTLTSKIVWDQKTVTLGDSVEIYIKVPKNVNGTLLAYNENSDEIGRGVVKEGIATAILKDLPVDKNVINAKLTSSIGTFENAVYIPVQPIVTVPETMTVGEDAYAIVETSEGKGAYVTAFYKNQTDDESKYEWLTSLGFANNKAKISLSSLKKGAYDIIISYYYNDADLVEFNYKIQVVDNASLNKVNPKIVANDLTVYYNSGKYYSVTVYGESGEVATHTPVIFTLNGKQVAKVNTDEKGVAKFMVIQTPVNNGKIVAKALGVTSTKKLTIKRVITLKKATVKKSAKKLVLKATLKKVNGKYLKGKKITFKFNGKKYTAKTSSKGVAKVTIKSSVLKKLKVGKKITYQATYVKDTVKQSVKVKG